MWPHGCGSVRIAAALAFIELGPFLCPIRPPLQRTTRSRIRTLETLRYFAKSVRNLGTPAAPSMEVAGNLRPHCTLESVDRFYTRAALVEQRKQWKAGGKAVVFTNGCYDLLHPGHVRFLEQARSLGDVLILALNSD